MTLGLTFLSFVFAYWWKNYILNFKKVLSLTWRNTLKRTPKVISNQNLFSRFQSWCWFWCWSWCLKKQNQAIKQSDWPWKFWDRRVFHYSRVGLVHPLSARKWPNLPRLPPPPPTPLSPPNFYIIITWSWRLKNKNQKMVIKIAGRKILVPHQNFRNPYCHCFC